jgi:hypothetical protein
VDRFAPEVVLATGFFATAFLAAGFLTAAFFATGFVLADFFTESIGIEFKPNIGAR